MTELEITESRDQRSRLQCHCMLEVSLGLQLL